MTQISIHVKDVHKNMGATPALQGVSTVFAPAKLHGLIGPDGAGKTTLLRILVGLLSPNQGAINFFKKKQLIAFDRIRPKIAYMPQQQSLYADLSVGEHLEFFKDLYVIPQEAYRLRRAELLHMTRMEPFQNRQAGKLSGGMYKKLGLMCALLQSPDILFLDEPTNGVDPISRREFWEMLYQLLKKNILIIVSTAYMDEAERCSRVHVLEEGKILAAGEPRSILEHAGVKNFEALFLKIAGTGK
ncbi:ABC transporter ATP-binding protein [bacterium]|nr:ABC transporter ATP-binding protein [bacterium]